MSNQNAVLIQKDITDAVNGSVERLQKEGLALPENYNYSNALKSAFFALKETKTTSGAPALEACTTESIANTLLDMVTQGLSPAKNQCYFIVYGDQLQMQRSYFGTQAVLKRLNNVKDIWSNVIYEGDDFVMKIEGGRDVFEKHDTSWTNRDNKILGAYAVIKQEDDDEVLTVMTMKEIQTAWNQSRTGQSVHKKFPQEMAQRTVINRAAKNYINTSDDSDLLVQAINATTDNEFENDNAPRDVTEDMKEEIAENANKEVIDFDEPVEEVQKPRVIEDATEEVESVQEMNEEDNQGALFNSINETTRQAAKTELEF